MAETRYASTDGNDSNDGKDASKDHAWATIQHGVDELAKLQGGTLIVAPGSYNKAVVMDRQKYSNIHIMGEPVKAAHASDTGTSVAPGDCDQHPQIGGDPATPSRATSLRLKKPLA